MRAACACPPCSRSWSAGRQRLAACRLKRMAVRRLPWRLPCRGRRPSWSLQGTARPEACQLPQRCAPPQRRLGARTWQLLRHLTASTQAHTERRRGRTFLCQAQPPRQERPQEQNPAHRQGQAGRGVAARAQLHQGSPQCQQGPGVRGQADKQACERPWVHLQVHMRQALRPQQRQQVLCSLTMGQGPVRPWVTHPAQLHHQGPWRRQWALLAGGQVWGKGQARCRVAPGHQG